MSNQSLYLYLQDHCRKHVVRNYLEIGTREGGSLQVVLKEAKSTLESVWIADLWTNDYGGTGRGSHSHIDLLLDSFGFDAKRVFLDGNSQHTIPALMPEKAEAFDLILVDGDHSYEGGRADLENTWPLIRPGGAVVFHDITHPSHMYLLECFMQFAIERNALLRVITEPCGVGVAFKG